LSCSLVAEFGLRMPKFVPVTDSEKPKAEQSAFSKDMMIHRMFDDPHSVVKPHELQKRGFADGEVGWGNLNSYGSDEKDERAQILKHAEGSNKMVRNEKGLWVKAKVVDDDGGSQTSSSQRGMGRGRGIPVLEKLRQEQAAESEDNNEEYVKSKRDVSESPQRRKDEPSRRRDRNDRSRSDSRGRRTSSRRNRSGSRSPKRKEKSWHRADSRRSRSRDRNSRDRYNSRSRDYERRKSDRDDSRERTKRRRSRSRSSSESDRHRKRDRSESKESRTIQKVVKEQESVRERSLVADKNNESNSKSAVMRESFRRSPSPLDDRHDSPSQMTAIQVINHFHEVYSEKSSKRLDHIAEIFEETAAIQSMKALNKVYLSGKDAVKSSFARTQPQTIVTSKRIYIECPFFKETNVSSSGADGLVTYACDLHRSGTSPGLGDLSKDTVLLYECGHNHILRVWGMNDTSHLSQNEDLTEDMVYDSEIWKAIEKIIGEKWKLVIEENQIDLMLISHFHNYDKMEVWG
jgi:hypothetical protein